MQNFNSYISINSYEITLFEELILGVKDCSLIELFILKSTSTEKTIQIDEQSKLIWMLFSKGDMKKAPLVYIGYTNTLFYSIYYNLKCTAMYICVCVFDWRINLLTRINWD